MVCSYTVHRTQYDRLSQQQLNFLSCHSVTAAEAEKKPEEKKKSPSPEKGEAPEFIEKFSDTVSYIFRTRMLKITVR